jgi:hypothetical protein
MLPGPDDCWLADQSGQRYTSELRLVAVDLGRKASSRLGTPGSESATCAPGNE